MAKQRKRISDITVTEFMTGRYGYDELSKLLVIISMILLTILVTTVFYFVLAYFDTANLIPSTLSVSTSFFAVFLMYKRSPYYALAYAANDIVLIILWILASISDISYISVVICFITFLVNDIYGFVNWRRMQKKQAE